MPYFFDSHAHLTHEKMEEQSLIPLLERAQNAGVREIVNICTDRLSLEKGLALSADYPWIYQAAATTPHDVDKEGEEIFPLMAEAARSKQLVAVGETGLDYYYEHSQPETQKLFLRRYLHLALECRLPIIIHCREAFNDLFTILDSDYSTNGQWHPGVLHCFTGTIKEAEEVIKRGWYLSLSGIVTFKRSEELRLVAKETPLNRLLIETDTPYLAPQSHRGKPNEPAFLPETAQMIADIKGVSIDQVAEQTLKNARHLFLNASDTANF